MSIANGITFVNPKEEPLNLGVRALLMSIQQIKNLSRQGKILRLIEMNDVLLHLNTQEALNSGNINGKHSGSGLIEKVISRIMKKRDNLQKELFDSKKLKELDQLNAMVVNNLKAQMLIPAKIEEYRLKNDQEMVKSFEEQYKFTKQQLDIKIKERIEFITKLQNRKR